MNNIEPISIKKSSEEKLAEFISLIFHPLLMPTYGFVLIFFTENYISVFTTFALKTAITAITFLFTFLFPLINTLILLKTKKIQSIKMQNHKERILPYASTVFYYFALYYLFYNTQIPGFFKVLILGASLAVLSTFIINFFWKISAHTTGIGGICGALLATAYKLQTEFILLIMFIVIIAGIVGYARLKLNAHTPPQIYLGFLLGFLIEFFTILLY